MTPCPLCHDKGYIANPYNGHMQGHFACTCPKGQAFAAQWVKPTAKKDAE